jgi:hypothetical protein
LQNQKDLVQVSLPYRLFAALVELPRGSSERAQTATPGNMDRSEQVPGPWTIVGRLFCFFALIAILAFFLNAMISSGLRRIRTSSFGAENQMMQGKINAQIIISGSSRASSHYDPRIIQAVTRLTAFNMGRNGSQTDVQVAVLRAYLEHNRKPELVIHNLDAFSFVTTREIYDPAQYVPYLDDPVLYSPLKRINPSEWKSRYIPLYGYVVDDMNFSWILGLKGFFGSSPREKLFSGFDPRAKRWSDEFQNFKNNNSKGISFEIEPRGIQDLEELILICKQNGIPLILVYSPEYIEMQELTNNRVEIFNKFHELADRYKVPLWDYSDWKYAGNRGLFQNSQHLNDQGANIFTSDLAERLKEYSADHFLPSRGTEGSKTAMPFNGKN